MSHVLSLQAQRKRPEFLSEFSHAAAPPALKTLPKTAALCVIGYGNVGKAFLNQIDACREKLLQTHYLDLQICGLLNSRRMLFTNHSVGAGDALAALSAAAPDPDLGAIADHFMALESPHNIVLDLSGANSVADHYAAWLRRGIHVVTCSKHAGSGSFARYQEIQTAARSGGAAFRYESTVGAGLPVIAPLQNLLNTGDEVHAIKGVLSGTLAYLFHGLAAGGRFSDLVRDAKAKGYTEPDPRCDLSGQDVARKLVILARECGQRLSVEDLTVESLVPDHLQHVSVDEFMARLDELNDVITPRQTAAAQAGKKLAYVAQCIPGKSARIGIEMLAPHDAIAQGSGTDNVLQFRTARYCNTPLVIQGPGAGAEVTAMGVFGDVLGILR